MKKQVITFSLSSNLIFISLSVINSSFLDRVLYARKGAEDPTLKTTDLGGDNITVEDAIVSCSKRLLDMV